GQGREGFWLDYSRVVCVNRHSRTPRDCESASHFRSPESVGGIPFFLTEWLEQFCCSWLGLFVRDRRRSVVCRHGTLRTATDPAGVVCGGASRSPSQLFWTR